MSSKFFCFFNFFPNTRNKDTAIRKYSIVQTGAKIQFGGLKTGLFKCAYQEVIAGIVNIDPNKPTPSQTTTRLSSFNHLCILSVDMFYAYLGKDS